MRPTLLLLTGAAVALVTAGPVEAWSGYGGHARPGYGLHGPSLSFAAAAARIKAKHSRYNRSPHPRSYYHGAYPRSYYPGPAYGAPSYSGRLPREYYGHEYEQYTRGYEFWGRE